MAAPTAYMLWIAVGTTCDRGRGQSCVADPVACAIRMAIGYIASILRLTRDASSYLIARGCARACGATVCTGDGSPTQGQPAQHGSSRPPHITTSKHYPQLSSACNCTCLPRLSGASSAPHALDTRPPRPSVPHTRHRGLQSLLRGRCQPKACQLVIKLLPLPFMH